VVQASASHVPSIGASDHEPLARFPSGRERLDSQPIVRGIPDA
jgi:hypothetical protein